MDGHCLHSFQQQVLMNSVHISFLLCKYEHLPTAENINVCCCSLWFFWYLQPSQHMEVLTGGGVFWRHSSKYTILASSLTYSTSYKDTAFVYLTNLLLLEFTLNCRRKKTYLNDIQASSTSPSHIDGDRFDQCTLGKVLDLLRHSSTVKQGLSLSLSCI